MGSLKSSEKMIIPKIFEYDNYIFHLKKEIKGSLTIFTDNSCQFKGDLNRIVIDKKKILTEEEMQEEVKKKISDTYFDNVDGFDEINGKDLPFFDTIDYVVSKNKSRPKVLFIGYKFNYPDTIKDSIQRANFDCDTLILEQNIELYNPKARLVDNKPDHIFEMITDKVEMNRYDNYVLDIPNLALTYNDYTNTKKLLSYLKSKNKKMIILNGGSFTKFSRIFGDDYDHMLMDEKYLIRCGKHELIKTQISNILL